MTQALATASIQGLMMGMWFLASAYGQYVAGLLGAGMSMADPKASNFSKLVAYTGGYQQLAIYALIAGVVLIAISPMVRRLMKGRTLSRETEQKSNISVCLTKQSGRNDHCGTKLVTRYGTTTQMRNLLFSLFLVPLALFAQDHSDALVRWTDIETAQNSRQKRRQTAADRRVYFLVRALPDAGREHVSRPANGGIYQRQFPPGEIRCGRCGHDHVQWQDLHQPELQPGHEGFTQRHT
jgi:hypothetical protein